MVGYSGTPLIKKLGFNGTLSVLAIDPPPDYADWLGELPEGVRLIRRTSKPIEAAHVFVTRRTNLADKLAELRQRLVSDGFVWVSWPKKASKVETDITEDVIRTVALPLGFVDIKVCAVSEVWSALKLVIRKDQRTT